MPKSRFALLAVLYALLICYASTIVGPAGPHFVPLHPVEALRRFLATSYVDNGSDQRSDWMGNLLLLVPFGFLATGSLWPHAPWLRPGVVLSAFAVCLALVLAVKYAQLFFPPRTVTLNYILAQSIGSALGVGLFAATHGRLAALARGHSGGQLEHLAVMLQAYTAAVILFLLMPLDFALSGADLRLQFDRLPECVTAITGQGRPMLIRAVLILAAALAMTPVGMLLAVTRHGRTAIGRSVEAATVRGFLLNLVVFALSTLLISGSPTLLAVFYRTLGIAAGAWFMRLLSRSDPVRIRRFLHGAALWLALPYLGLLLLANGLMSTHWLTADQAMSMGYPLGLLPLFDYYIVTKAEAAKNIVGHVVMYAPAGVLAWLRGRSVAATPVAALLAFCIETARYFQPGLEGDVNTVAVAALSAWLTARLMPHLWAMLEAVAPPRVPAGPGVVGWRDRTVTARVAARDRVQFTGEIEHY